ncbi:unnamed protein product [Closterium sp. NIES-64]|nr:unnamed protein product [Closterium sp. NIES-64]
MEPDGSKPTQSAHPGPCAALLLPSLHSPSLLSPPLLPLSLPPPRCPPLAAPPFDAGLLAAPSPPIPTLLPPPARFSPNDKYYNQRVAGTARLVGIKVSHHPHPFPPSLTPPHLFPRPLSILHPPARFSPDDKYSKQNMACKSGLPSSPTVPTVLNPSPPIPTCPHTSPPCLPPPARFSPDDKYSKQRVACKSRFKLLPSQQQPYKY